MLVGDDGVALEQDARERLLASPAPAYRGACSKCAMPGPPALPTAAGVPVALVLVLDREAPRFITEAECTMRWGLSLPLVRLWPDSPVLALRAEMALEHYGLL